MDGTDNGVLIVWSGHRGYRPQLVESAHVAAQEILDCRMSYARVECIDPQSGLWIDCGSEVREEVDRLEQEAAEWRRHQAGTRAMRGALR